MSDEVKITQPTQEDMELGRSGFSVESVKPSVFKENEANCFIKSTKLAKEIASFFYQLTDDCVGALVYIDQFNRVAADIFLQNNKFTNNTKFKAVIPTTVDIKANSVVDQMRNMNSAKNAMLALTKDAKNVFEEFLPANAPRKVVAPNKQEPIWNQIFFEKPAQRNVFGVNPNAISTYGIITIAPERVLAKIYGEKVTETENFYYQYVLTVINIVQSAVPGVSLPAYNIKISKINGKNVAENCQEIGLSMNNELGFVTPF